MLLDATSTPLVADAAPFARTDADESRPATPAPPGEMAASVPSAPPARGCSPAAARPPVERSLEVAPYDVRAALRLSRELGVSDVVAQILVRRGLAQPAAARRWLDAEVRHPLCAFGGLAEGAAVVLAHVRRGSRIVVHGDYDCDGVCSTAILVRALRTLGVDPSWYLPRRLADGYGLAAATVDRLAAAGTELLITADCAITAVEEVARARAAGMDVVVTDHHSPRADGRLPDAPIIHPALGGNPCADLCAAGVAYKLAGALLQGAGMDPALADADLDLVALATVADVVPLHDENRALVRCGLRALAATRKPGLRALMAVARVDPSRLDAGSVGFRLAPRINAAGRLHDADAGLELLLTGDDERARQVAAELDAVNAERREVERRILWEAQALLGEQPPGAAAHVLAGEGWHPGVVGIVAARIAEKTHRPAVLIALDGDEGTGSGRSIPGFDLLEGLRAGAGELLRFGGHRAAAGLSIRADRVEAFRACFAAHAARVLGPEQLVPRERVDAVVGGDALGLELAEELERLAPFGAGNREPALLVRAGRIVAARAVGEDRHTACALDAGGARSRAIAFGTGGRAPAGEHETVDVALRLEADRWNGTVTPKVHLRAVLPCRPAPITVVGEPTAFWPGLLAELDRPLDAASVRPAGQGTPAWLTAARDLRGRSLIGVLADLVASGEPVLALCAHAPQRAAALGARVGGFRLAGWEALAADPGLLAGIAHVVAIDPPAVPGLARALDPSSTGVLTHLAWGPGEVGFARTVLAWNYALREPLASTYRALRAAGGAGGAALERLLRGDAPQPRTPALAGRLVRVLCELELAQLDRSRARLDVAEAVARTELERSPAFRVYREHHDDGERWLTSTTPPPRN